MIEVVDPQNEVAIKEFVLFQKQVYRKEGIRLSVSVSETTSFFRHNSPFAEGRRFHVLVARDESRVVARAVAVVDQRYNQRWGEQLGHIVMFEALSGAQKASCMLLRTASEWLRNQGAVAVRTGFGPFEPGFVIDYYDKFLPRMGRHNLPYYHSFLKQAGFETEKGAAEYVIRVCDELVSRYKHYLESAQRLGYEITALRNIPADRRLASFTRVWNDAYESHWGLAPLSEREVSALFDEKCNASTLELSTVAYRGDTPVAVALVRDTTPFRRVFRKYLGWRSRDEHLASFAVGVSPSERGRGLSLSLAAYAYLRLIAQGAAYLSYGLVTDDNWPSRRSAEKLGAYVCANYLTYRKQLIIENTK